MSRLLVRNFSVSLDGYSAGPHQDLDNPLGVGGMQLHEWIFATRSGSEMIGKEGRNFRTGSILNHGIAAGATSKHGRKHREKDREFHRKAIGFEL